MPAMQAAVAGLAVAGNHSRGGIINVRASPCLPSKLNPRVEVPPLRPCFGANTLQRLCEGRHEGSRSGIQQPAPVLRPYAGRKAAKVAKTKNREDAKRSKLYGKFGKLIINAVRKGGADPTTNALLDKLLKDAKASNVPRDLIERNLKRGSDKNQADFQELTYEAYGFGGAGIIIETNTDNPNRTNSDVRDIVRKAGGKMADQGSVAFNFARKGVFRVPASGVASEDELMEAAIMAGADDVKGPEPLGDGADDETEPAYIILTAAEGPSQDQTVCCW
eukprot:scaffold1945_cov395-Prasinococcus_capsulatus_cf.AAC.11